MRRRSSAVWPWMPVVLLAGSWAWGQTPDAGVVPPDASSSSAADRGTRPVDAGAADAGEGGWQASRLGELGAREQELSRLAAAYAALGAEQVRPPLELALPKDVDFSDPRKVLKLVGTLQRRRQALSGQLEEHEARLRLIEPQLRPAIDRLERLERRKKRWPLLRIPE